MFEFMKSETFKVVGSTVLGIGIMAAIKPMCRTDDCKVQKAPPVEEIMKSTYQIGQKCYKFKTNHADCPAKGSIEPFLSGIF
jgi:hypothetical protein